MNRALGRVSTVEDFRVPPRIPSLLAPNADLDVCRSSSAVDVRGLSPDSRTDSKEALFGLSNAAGSLRLERLDERIVAVLPDLAQGLFHLVGHSPPLGLRRKARRRAVARQLDLDLVVQRGGKEIVLLELSKTVKPCVGVQQRVRRTTG